MDVFSKRIFFALMVITMGLPVIAQDIRNDIHWFDSLFSTNASLEITDDQKQALVKKRIQADEHNSPKGIARTMIEEGIREFRNTKNYGNAMNSLMQAYALEMGEGLTREEFFTCVALARVFESVEYFDKSLDYLNEAINYVNSDSTLMKAFIYNERGRVHQHEGLLDSALNDYNTMLGMARGVDDKSMESDALFFLGELYLQKKDYTEAYNQHKAALDIRRIINDRSKEAQSLKAIGDVYLAQNNTDRALLNHKAAIKIRKELNDKTGLTESYSSAGEVYLKMNSYYQAVENFRLALSNSQESLQYEETLKAHELLSLSYKAIGDFKNALFHKEEAIRFNDVLEREKAERELVEEQNKHFLDQKETEIAQLENTKRENEEKIQFQEQLNKTLYLLIGSVAVIGLLLLFMYFQKRRSNRILKEINETKDKLFSIIGHDLKAPLNSLTAFSSLLIHHSETLTKEEIKMLSGDVDKSLKNLFGLLENLLEWARSQTGNINFKPEPFDLTVVLKENIELLKPLADKKGIAIINNYPDKLMTNAHRNSINTVVRNLISNAIKFTTSSGSIILAGSIENKSVKVSVTDNGLGMSEDVVKKLFKVGTKVSTPGTAQEKGTGLGLILCKDFVEKNGGTISVESREGHGSKFQFTIPSA